MENHDSYKDQYQAAIETWWKGRIDGEEFADRRWHQWVKCLDMTERDRLPASFKNASTLIGFPCDEGVQRNRGRTGAAGGPHAIRQALSNLPIPETANPDSSFFDAGNVEFSDQDSSVDSLSETQKALGSLVSTVLEKGGFPIILGGGHEVTYGAYSGVKDYIEKSIENSDAVIGIINFDAHFDNREPGDGGVNSGTGFWQIHQDSQRKNQKFCYLAVGIQEMGNTRRLFDRARQTGTQTILARDFTPRKLTENLSLLKNFMAGCDKLYLTIDLDVFSMANAPGVSAPSVMGIVPDELFQHFLLEIFNSNKLLAMDIAELNPELDENSKTARLAAALIYEFVRWKLT